MTARKPSTTLPVAAAQALSREEKQQELDALRIGAVREGTCLHSLLTYLGQKAVADATEPLKEYTIGVEALGKPENYDPRLDPTVRVDIGKLRTKLRDYYQGPGASRPLRAEIPKGQFHLAFVRRAQITPAAPIDTRSWWWRPAMIAAATLLATTALVGAVRPWSRVPPARAELSPELGAFWAPFLENRIPTLLAYGTPLFLKGDGWFFRDPQVNREQDGERAEGVEKLVSVLKPTQRRWVQNFTGLGEAEALFMITRLLASQQVALAVQRSSNLSWEDMKGRHVILLGSHKFNPQIPDLPVVPKFKAVNAPPRIANATPVDGEPTGYFTVTTMPNGPIVEEYALVSVYGGFDAGARLVVLSCSSSEGTGAAAEYVTRPDTMKELFAAMKIDPRKDTLPKAFQVVIKAKMNGGVPVHLSHVTHHVLAQ